MMRKCGCTMGQQAIVLPAPDCTNCAIAWYDSLLQPMQQLFTHSHMPTSCPRTDQPDSADPKIHPTATVEEPQRTQTAPSRLDRGTMHLCLTEHIWPATRLQRGIQGGPTPRRNCTHRRRGGCRGTRYGEMTPVELLPQTSEPERKIFMERPAMAILPPTM